MEMFLCAICTAPYGGPATLELENGKHPCSVCNKLFQRCRIYQPERWSVSLPTAMCRDCADARTCCQVCYCDMETLKVNKIYSDVIPPGGSFLQTDVSADTLRKRYEKTFLQHMKKFVPAFSCRLTLITLQNADEELIKEVYSHLCIARALIDGKKHTSTAGNSIGIYLTINLSSAWRSTLFLDISSTCSSIQTYLDQISSLCESIQNIEIAKRHQLANVFRASICRNNGNGNDNDIINDHKLLKQNNSSIIEKCAVDTQLTKVKVAVIEHTSFSLKLLITTTFLAEILCLLKIYTEVDKEIEIIVDIGN